MLLRKTDLKEKVWFRSDRCFSVDNKWYFSTREGLDVGPFGSKDKASRGVKRYIESIQLGKTSGMYAAKVASNGVWASTGFN